MSYTNPTRDDKETVVTINNLQEAEEILSAYVPKSGRLTAKDTTLERIRPLMELLGNPQDRLRIIHIAGTSGKTSTAYYLAALLTAAGQKTGLTVSPHVDSITERLQINGQPLAEAEFCRQLGIFLDLVQEAKDRPTYFELLYAFFIWLLSEMNVDYAVVETGLGGLGDATNVAGRPDKVCVITDIGLDHQSVLGDTLAEIAAQKAGIIHEGNHAFMYRQADEIRGVVQDWAAERQASLHIVDEPQVQADLPAYQQRNWGLAYEVYEYLRQRDHLPYLTGQVLAKTRQINVPGRMDIRHIDGKTLVMDGAHNEQKMQTFIDSFKRLYPDTKPAVLVSLKEGKEYEAVVPMLRALADRFIVTAFETVQDLPIKSMDADKLAEAFRQAGAQVEVIADKHQALQALLEGPEEVCVITGSFYLLGQIRSDKILK